jgi:hypothetical protein
MPIIAPARPILLLSLLGCLCATAAGAADPTFPALAGPYFGQPLPGLRAEMFAPGVVSTEYHDDGAPAFTPDGRECFWRINGYRDSVGRPAVIFWSREVDGRWTEPGPAPFSSPHGEWGLCMQPDGRRLYFWSRRPCPGAPTGTDGSPWFVDRTPAGWSEPRPLTLPVDPARLGRYFSVGIDGSLYCALEDSGGTSRGVSLFRLRRDGERFAAPEPMGTVPAVAGREVAVPCVAPDGNALVFTTSAQQRLLLMASFRMPDGRWTVPRLLGDHINAGRHTKFAGFSPDGKYLFFVSNRESPRLNPRKLWKTDLFGGPQREPLCDIYWVDARALRDAP